ncbi:hypothetical protein SCP_0705260 [Sparassis crispa]|uniref:Prolyl 4-hydroxylase alpha subunit Fe(2+) 2OG dioxygenase domain-containing protein n=1 Tax=Sparassis crispa TaxID=139825 RepID=A0A401GT45_9APHY|nr:hypothetical protein SCP_0705260 [Sparassis crispa]GBE85339.1 hypothetical protein SCP_0705260 [Sparassis crispa]
MCMTSPIENVYADLFNGSLKSVVRAELYKLNVCGPGSLFKSHVDMPRREKMFGSLVVAFPTPHEGRALVLRHEGQSWTFDPGEIFPKSEK